MVKIDPENKKWIIKFRPKEQRPNQRDDKFEIFRSAIGLEDTNNIFDLNRFTGSHMTDPIHKEEDTITDIDSYHDPYIIARITQEQANRLRRDPNVEYVEEEQFLAPEAQIMPWGIAKVKAPPAWTVDTKRGQGAIVAVIDTGGERSHPDLKSVKVNQSFVGDGNPDAVTNKGWGSFWHGVHVIGTVCATDNTEGVVGVAPDCTGWSLKCGVRAELNGQKLTLLHNVAILEAINYVKNNGGNVVNMSFGAYAPVQSMADSIKDGYDRLNILFVAAHGNDARNTSIHYPSSYYGVIGVSAIAESNNMAGFSNIGPPVDVCAPGVNIISTMTEGGYGPSQGTSMASPHVAGICALGFSAYKEDQCNPIYTGKAEKKNKSVEEALYRSVNKLGKFTSRRTDTYGRGLPEVDKMTKMMLGIQT